MRTYHASSTRHDVTFTAQLHVFPEGDCLETVQRMGEMGGSTIHEAAFPLRNLGSASRDEYLRVMLESIIDREFNPNIGRTKLTQLRQPFAGLPLRGPDHDTNP